VLIEEADYRGSQEGFGKMSEGRHSMGISRTMFIAGIIVAILISCGIMAFLSSQFGIFKGPKGDKGDIGNTGLQGPQGPQGQQSPALVFAKWDVHWWTINSSTLERLAEVGTSTFSSTFSYDWGLSAVFGEHSDYVGFRATMQVNMQRDGPVTFTVGGDDGYSFSIDGVAKIDDYSLHAYRTTTTIIANLTQGLHTLSLDYFEGPEAARVTFDCDHDLLAWLV
jgi:hypothetical protein